MKQSQLFTKTLRNPPRDEVSTNAILLERGGFVHKNSAGIYTYLPLGWRVFQKIANIIRKEMNVIGGQEMFMPAMVEKRYLEASDRWDIDVGFRVRELGEEDAQFALGWTHEEVLTDVARRYIDSYKDLPFSAYQIQTKFRNEKRAKSGLLRGREFAMKDLYSFHESEEDLLRFYEMVKDAYFAIFEQCGLETVYTVAAGGDFTANYTHEFQVLTEVGEDTVFYCGACGYAENEEIVENKEETICSKCGGEVSRKNGIEVGNLFQLGTKYSSALDLQFVDDNNEKHDVVMGSYGIGLGRLMGAVVEVHHDEDGIIWPENIAPYTIHLLALPGGEEEAKKLYHSLQDEGYEILYDERDTSVGEKFKDADLLGLPYRIVVSERSLKKLKVEVKKRNEEKFDLVLLEELRRYLEEELG